MSDHVQTVTKTKALQDNLDDVTKSFASKVTTQSKQCKRVSEDLQNLLELNQSLIVKLTELIGRVEKHIHDCLIAKTTGVSVAAVGTSMVVGGWIAGLVLAVPTFGLSLTVPAIMTVAGTATAVAGGLTTAGTELANGIISKQFLDEINDINKVQSVAAHNAEETLRKIKYIITELSIGENVDETLLISLVLHGIKSEEIDLDNIDESIQHLQVKLRMCRPDKINGHSNGNIVSGSMKVAGAALNATNCLVAGGAGLIDDVSIAVLRSLGIGTSSAVIQGVLRSVAASLGVVFTVIDIVGLVRDYNDPNPLIKELERIIGLYSSDIYCCQVLISLL